MRRKHARDIEAVVEVHDHDQRATKQVNVHLTNPGAAQALDDFRPHAAVMLAVRRNRRRIVSEVHRQDVAVHAQSTTFCED